MKGKAVSLLGVTLAVGFFGCNLRGKKQPDEEGKKDKEQVQEVFNAWVSAHNNHKLSALDTLYADEVFYYSKNFKKRDLIKDKSEAFKPGSDFRIEVIDPQWEFKGDEATVNYEKYGYWQGKEVHVVSELALKKFGKSWKITKEVDTEVKSAKKQPSGGWVSETQVEAVGACWIAIPVIQEQAQEEYGLEGPSHPDDVEVSGPVNYQGKPAWEVMYLEGGGGHWYVEFFVWVEVSSGKILGKKDIYHQS